jgi:hypothetical protein
VVMNWGTKQVSLAPPSIPIVKVFPEAIFLESTCNGKIGIYSTIIYP